MDEYIKLYIENSNKFFEESNERIAQAESKIQSHDQTLYGVAKDNGLVSELKEAKKSLLNLQKLSWILLGACIVLGSAVFWKLVFGA